VISPPASSTRRRQAAGITARAAFGLIAVWVGLTTALAKTGPAALYTALDLPFRLLCHRIPERVLTIAGAPMPLCSRCAGIWLGLSVSAAIAWPVLSVRALRFVVAAACALMLAEVITQDLGLHPVFHPTRLASGLLLSVPFGGAIGGLITRELLRPRSTSASAASPDETTGARVRGATSR
jgi:uncharacterized membrane protein